MNRQIIILEERPSFSGEDALAISNGDKMEWAVVGWSEVSDRWHEQLRFFGGVFSRTRARY